MININMPTLRKFNQVLNILEATDPNNPTHDSNESESSDLAFIDHCDYDTDIDYCGETLYVYVTFEHKPKAVDYEFDASRGEGRDVLALCPVKVLRILAFKEPEHFRVTDAETLYHISQLVLQKAQDEGYIKDEVWRAAWE
jgi:hypothetical protein